MLWHLRKNGSRLVSKIALFVIALSFHAFAQKVDVGDLFDDDYCNKHGNIAFENGVCPKCKEEEGGKPVYCYKHPSIALENGVCPKCKEEEGVKPVYCYKHPSIALVNGVCHKCKEEEGVKPVYCYKHPSIALENGVCSKCKEEEGGTPVYCYKHPSIALVNGVCHKCKEEQVGKNIVAIIIVSFVVLALRNYLKPHDNDTWEPGKDWTSPPGNPDIFYSPPLSALDGGNGGFSEICRARRKSGEKLENGLYMLKYPRPDAPKSVRDAVIFEAQALDFLEKNGFRNAPVCRGLGQILDYSNQVPWYLMSCAPGRSLYDLMEEWSGKNFDRNVQGRLLKRLCEALVALHKLGVSHRDIKPRNIFWDGNRVTIIDFGSARVPGITNPCESDIPGTDRWEAPEQAAGRPVGQMADVYSFGLIFCSVVLTRPFLDRSGPIQARYGAEVSRRAGERVAQILFEKALAENPEARAGALFALKDAL